MLAKLIAWLKKLGHIFSLIWDKIVSWFSVADNVQNRVTTFVNNVDALVRNIEHEVKAIRDFEFNPQWKNRVINVPDAIDAVKGFVESVPTDLQEKFKRMSTDIRALFHLFEHGPPGTGGDPEASVGAIGKIVSWSSMIEQIFEVLEGTVSDLSSIVDDLRQIREQLETLDVLFLSQGSTKKTIDAHYRKRLRS